jgi:threonyl-tRNA synthetase
MSYPLETRRHSAAHVMAAAIKRLFPQAKFGVGPVIENGFYYDIDLGRSLSQEDLQAIDAEMQKICKENPAFVKETVSLEEAIQRFSAAGQTYKVELLNDLKTRGTTKVGEDLAQEVDPAAVGEVTVYQTGDFMDLCRGPHVANAKEIGAWKLTKIAGAYWRGKDTNPQMQRIYGLCFATAEELAAHVKMIEEAEKRDHRRLGAELELFTFDDQVGPGLPLWMPNGTAIIQRLEELAFEAEEKGGYVRVRTPHIAKEQLYLTSGHLPYYKDSMFPPMEMDGERYYLKAMNCPHHHKLFSARPRSYRELPLRLAEYGTCYRYEDSGSLFGLMRVRSLQMNDAHIYCTPEQFRSEFLAVIDLYKYYFKLFGISKFEMHIWY